MKWSKNIHKSTWMLALAASLFACKPDIELPTPKKGTADFSSYVSIGNSLTAGYADGALYLEGQLASYPNMLATQFATVGGGDFKQPLVPAGNGVGGDGRSGKLVLANLGGGNLLPLPTQGDASIFAQRIGSEGPFNNVGVPGARSFHMNFPGYGSGLGNPFFARFASSPTTTMVQDAVMANPTFVSLWIGNNDVLGYALAGGVDDQITPQLMFDQSVDQTIAQLKAANPSIGGILNSVPNILQAPYFTTIQWNDFVLTAEQATQLNAGLRAAVSAGARPQVEAAVRVQVEAQVAAQVEIQVRAQVEEAVRAQVEAQVAAAVLAQTKQTLISSGMSEAEAQAAATAYVASPEGQAIVASQTEAQMLSPEVQGLIESNTQAQMQSAAVQGMIDSLTDTQMQSETVQAIIEQQLSLLLAGLPSFSEGENPFLVADENETLGFRLANANDKILLSALLFVRDPQNAGQPIPDELFLDSEEVNAIQAAVQGYNAKIKATAQENNMAYFDVYSFLDKVKTGYVYDAVNYSSTFVTGGAFSLDGLHLTPRGNALIANEMIREINSFYQANIPIVNVNDYRGVELP